MTDLLLFLILVTLIAMLFELRKQRCDFTQEDAKVRHATDEVMEAQQHLPPQKQKQPTKGK